MSIFEAGSFLKILAAALFGGTVSSRSVAEVEESTFVTVKSPLRQYTSYAWRIVLSAVIATGGIAVSSPAVIIGAMLVAPLMSPMLGTTFALASSNWRGIVRTLLVTLLGSLACIIVAMLVTAIMPVSIDVETNSEVLSRITPRIADLIVALASGLMAAIALVRDDIPDALAGVAIAAALVPPLCIVGVCLYYQDLSSSLGALTLFLANYFAIQVMGLVVFFESDLRRKARDSREAITRRAKVVMAACILVALGLVCIPLVHASAEIVRNDELRQSASKAADDWLAESGFRLKAIDVANGEVSITIAGDGEVPSAEELQSALGDDELGGKKVRITVLRELTIDKAQA